MFNISLPYLRTSAQLDENSVGDGKMKFYIFKPVNGYHLENNLQTKKEIDQVRKFTKLVSRLLRASFLLLLLS